MAVGFGIVGAGMISALHADALQKSEKARLVAVCDLDRERAAKLDADPVCSAKCRTENQQPTKPRRSWRYANQKQTVQPVLMLLKSGG